jgi:hypothetical protein
MEVPQGWSHENCDSRVTFNMTKHVLCVGTVILMVALGVGFLAGLRRPVLPVALAQSAILTSSNVNFASIGITNRSKATIVYLACQPQVKSNGSWSNVQTPPSGQPMATLAAGESDLLIVDAGLLGEGARVPVLWGFVPSTASSKWQEVWADVVEWVTRPNSPGRGRLRTNYTEVIKLIDPAPENPFMPSAIPLFR